MSAPKLVLYSYWRSSSSYRVRFALAAKGLAYETVAVDLLKGEQASPEHKAKSPMGYVPCLVVDGRPFVESVAIIELLEDIAPTPALYPKDPFARAEVRAVVEMIACDIQPLQNRHVLLHVSKEQDVQRAWGKHFVERGLAGVEALLERIECARARTPGGASAPRFACGDTLSAADVFLVPQLYNARRFGVDLAAYPRIRAAEEAALATDAAARARPEAQPDAPPAERGAT